ncbi:sugar phosphate nucleotidyltransferase [Clostridium sp. DJ247]|uniref:sugar phosphate nucleotidyltransferase n=1 Tax=Clostridium sp. DJ247 TaxID=2726188 RepID=UPI001627C384|nr:sugar phosphate nucleotidyltransferase [Clostridium sp. DJ247]MBC2580262.1 NTP transferase domain-containing protein [Clostridium sp. DJ247]
MKGIILAGGTGSRLFPLTQVTNKHLLPVGKYPMIDHSIAKMKQAGIKDIMVILDKEYIGPVVKRLGSGYEYGVNFTYRTQDQPDGIAHALGLCKSFVGKDKSVVILGDNIFNDNIKDYVRDFERQDKGAKILIKQVKDPERYGVAEISQNKIVNIEEKPKFFKSNYCVTGIYMYDFRVFDIIKKLKPSSRGELEITDVNNWYIKDGTLTYSVLKDWWIDAGTFQALYHANELSKDIDLNYILSKEYQST